MEPQVLIWIGVWFLVLCLTLYIESITTDLISVLFSVGSFVSLILACFSVYYQIQVFVFLVVSIVLLFSLRPFLKRWMKVNETKTNIESIAGQVALVVKDIPIEDRGEIKLNGIIWTAVSNEFIKKGERAEILAVEGNKMLVKKHKTE